MTHLMHEAIEALYDGFTRVPPPKQVFGCDCCITAAELERLVTVPRRELTAKDLASYAFSVVSTVGSEDDLRYLFPRIAELAVLEGDDFLDPAVLFEKPVLGGWRHWPVREQDGVRAFAKAMGERFARQVFDPYSIDGWVCGMSRLDLDVTPLLRPLLADTGAAWTNLRGLYAWNEDELRRDLLANPFWTITNLNHARVVRWLKSPRVARLLDVARWPRGPMR